MSFQKLRVRNLPGGRRKLFHWGAAGGLLFFLLWNMNSAWAQGTDIHVEGEHWSEPLRGKIWVEDGSRLQAQTQGSQVLWTALKAGVVDIKNGNSVKTFTVLTLRQKKTWETLHSVLHHSLGLRLELNAGLVEVRGTLFRFSDWEHLAQACINLRCSYHFAAEVPDKLHEEIAQKFESRFLRISHYPYRVELGEGASLHAPSHDPSQKALHELLDRYGILFVEDKNALELSPLVKVQITLAEVKRDSDIKFGAQWNTQYSAQILPQMLTTSNSLTADLVANEHNGVSKILASPNLLCNSGKEAEFLAGGEFPIRILNYKIQDVVWKQYGILLKVRPTADLNGRMSLFIETEVSSLVWEAAVDGIPALNIDRVQSYFDLTKSQTIALSGLLKKEDGRTSDGLPLLSRIPILGALFSSKDYQSSKTELVVFVRPEVVNLKSREVTQNE